MEKAEANVIDVARVERIERSRMMLDNEGMCNCRGYGDCEDTTNQGNEKKKKDTLFQTRKRKQTFLANLYAKRRSLGRKRRRKRASAGCQDQTRARCACCRAVRIRVLLVPIVRLPSRTPVSRLVGILGFLGDVSMFNVIVFIKTSVRPVWKCSFSEKDRRSDTWKRRDLSQ